MGKQRATCPYCGKLSLDMYDSTTTRKREQIRCMHCGRTYSVVHGDGFVKTERTK